MIYILSGNDTKKKSVYLKKLCGDPEPIYLSGRSATKDALLSYAGSVSLFGDTPIVIIENFIKESGIALSKDELSSVKDSKTIFVFDEEKLLATDAKKYTKYATIEDFTTTQIKQAPRMNVFGIADNFSRRDKVSTWVLYREAVSVGVAPEEISGIIFWKIKTMIIDGTKLFSTSELKKRSSELVSIYHKSHLGEIDFTIGLEQFILSALSK